MNMQMMSYFLPHKPTMIARVGHTVVSKQKQQRVRWQPTVSGGDQHKKGQDIAYLADGIMVVVTCPLLL